MKGTGVSERDRRITMRLLACSLAAVILLCALLSLLVASLGRVDVRTKTSPGTPTALVSVGAPRSQLELKRMFSRMSRSYLEGDRRVCEPITHDYKEYVDRRIASGESVGLSVEEVIYVITDSVSIYGNHDVINLVGVDGEADARIYPERELINGYEPYHVTAVERINDITEIIAYRLLSLSSPERLRRTEHGYEYFPLDSRSEDSGSVFIIDLSVGEIDERVVFFPDTVRRIEVFPSPSIKEDADSKLILENPRKATDEEAELMRESGYAPESCRNITPKHWYERTDLRMFVSGGRVIIVDPTAKWAADTLPAEEKFTSAAICGYENETIYFTSSDSHGGSALWSYSHGEVTKLYESEAEHLAVYESYDGEYAELYEAYKQENAKYMILLIRRGECLWMSK